jgi:carbamate kinase
MVGVEAVIDKDLASCRLAIDIGADVLVILTDVGKVAINFGKPNQVELEQITLSEAQVFLNEGQFGTGSMAPKIQAAMEFVRATNCRAIITSLDKVVDAMAGKAGTRITE